MPFSSVAELKASDLFKRMPSLQQMGSGKLQRFLAVFNRVIERAMRGGASDDEAESRAVPIALTSARQAVSPPAGRTAEADLHFFALMAEDMQSGDLMNDSPDLTFPDIEDINDIMAGNAFLGPFTHDRSLAEPQGVIRQAMRREDVPAEVRDKIDPDIKVVIAASFFDDVPDDERFSTISPEWLEMKMADGTNLAIPHNFITTPNPANPDFMGIKMVAEGGNVEEPGVRSNSRGPTMSETPADESLEARYASLESELASVQEKAAGAEALAKELDGLKARIAGLAGVEETEEGNVDAEAAVKLAESRIATLETTLEKTSKIVEDMKHAALEQEADAFRAELFETREVSAEGADKWRERFLADSEGARELAATLPERTLRPGPGKAIANVEIVDDDKQAAALQADIDAALGISKGGA